MQETVLRLNSACRYITIDSRFSLSFKSTTHTPVSVNSEMTVPSMIHAIFAMRITQSKALIILGLPGRTATAPLLRVVREHTAVMVPVAGNSDCRLATIGQPAHLRCQWSAFTLFG